MKHVAAYLMAVLGGNASPTEADVKKILAAGGIEADANQLKLLLAQVQGKDIGELIAAGKSKLSAVPTGGAGAAAGAGAGAGAGAKAEAAPEPEEESEEEEEEEGFSLFD
ncbi:60S acidic ribosomal protein P2 [Plasmodiophora brassicae]|uniref:60S acidic ribosomal protein P2 n=1 Tax=Plasmodiophora brassicae TaxID=37360 RepID=A0A0G4ILF5_PLABS|nr:secrectory protein [Plasmodiophora brassicae]CEO96018.1 hypothetical protein PBRA_004708 [Plasmodiophora brassicae]SPQ93436.1 unnamed protein product [Plasmodiophora brassicae]